MVRIVARVYGMDMEWRTMYGTWPSLMCAYRRLASSLDVLVPSDGTSSLHDRSSEVTPRGRPHDSCTFTRRDDNKYFLQEKSG